ncbi:MAG: hypothetical protein V9E96_19595 [Chitinophagaceae bacterium]
MQQKEPPLFLLYNTSTITDNVLFNKNDTTKTSAIPVIYIKPQAVKEYFKDPSATLEIDISVEIEHQHSYR